MLCNCLLLRVNVGVCDLQCKKQVFFLLDIKKEGIVYVGERYERNRKITGNSKRVLV